MSDINDWQLKYDAETFNFGTESTDYPFRVQAEIGDTDTSTQDQPHPNSDGVIFGRDKLGGFTITFDCRILPAYPKVTRQWASSLDLYSLFKSAWRGGSTRLTAGKYATIANTDRDRMAYGRPRKISQKNANVRRGLLDFVATFDTNDPNFYSTTEKLAIITPVPSVGGGLTAPLTPPFSSVGSGNLLAEMENEGDTETWPVLYFHGPGVAMSIELLDGPTVLWKVLIPDRIKYDEILIVDTRPWARSATINGKPANGRVRGTQLEKCMLPVGTFDARFKVTDSTGVAFAAIRWRDAFASL